MATVDVILREKILNLGAEADVVKVKRGYASNFLIPTGKAFEATKGNLRNIESLKAARAKREADEMSTALTLASRLNKQRIKLELATGQGGKAFGSITTMDIHRALEEADKKFGNIDRHVIELEKPIKHTGDFEIPIKLHPDVTAILKVKVTASTDQGTDDEGPDEEGDE
jgi:large subunit ribosomal protein L9